MKKWMLGALVMSVLGGSAFAAKGPFSGEAFTLQIPAGWSMLDQGEIKGDAMWVFVSPNRNYRFRIRAKRTSNVAFADEVKGMLARFKKRAAGLRVLSCGSSKHQSKDDFHVICGRTFQPSGHRSREDE